MDALTALADSILARVLALGDAVLDGRPTDPELSRVVSISVEAARVYRQEIKKEARRTT